MITWVVEAVADLVVLAVGVVGVVAVAVVVEVNFSSSCRGMPLTLMPLQLSREIHPVA
jgi:hypothetical protein